MRPVVRIAQPREDIPPGPFNLPTYPDVYSYAALPSGSAVTLDMSVDTAPSRTLELQALAAGPAGSGAPYPLFSASSYTPTLRVWAGWATETGAEYLEDMGWYWAEEYGTAGGELQARYTSSESNVIGRRDYSSIGYIGYQDTTNWSAMTIPKFVQRNLDMAWSDLAFRKPAVSMTGTPAYVGTTADAWGAGYGTDLWSQIAGALQAARMRIAVGDDNSWKIKPATTAPGTVAAAFTDGPQGNLASYDSVQDLEGPVQVVASFEWTDSSGARKSIISASGVVSLGNSDRISEYETRNEPATKESAKAYCESRLRALRSVAMQRTITAPMMPWLRPDDTITITVDGTTYTCLIRTVSYNPIEGTMKITTREAVA